MKQIKLLVFLLTAVIIIPFALAGCNADKEKTTSEVSETESKADGAAAQESSEESKEEIIVPESIKTAGKIVLATSADFPPYEFKDNDEFAGIDIEIMQAVADLWDVELDVQDMKFDSILAAIQTGKADVGMAGMTINEERLESVNFSHTYAKATQVIIVKEDSDIKTSADLAGKKVGVQTGTTGAYYAEYDEKDGNIGSVERYNSGLDAVVALTKDKVDAVIIDKEPAKIFVEQNEGIKLIDESYTDEQYAIAIAKENTEIRDAVNKALETLDGNGTLKKITDKYIKAE